MTAKHAMFFALFAQGPVAAYVDGRCAGVSLPGALTTLPIVVLTYGPAEPVPIVDLALEDAGIRATLSFNREPVPTFVPWEAVWALAGSGGAIEFAGDIPPEIIAARADPRAVPDVPGMGSTKPRFTLVAPEDMPVPSDAGAEPSRPAPALHVVKAEPEETTT